MASFDHNLDGLADHVGDLEEEQERWTGGEVWAVGTAVEYSVYVEFGTSKMDPRPFFRPALFAYEANLAAAIESDTETSLDEIDSVDELVRTVAFGLERRIKRIITRKGLVDTGTMRASVLAVPGPDVGQLPTADDLETDEEGNPIDARVTLEAGRLA